MISGFVSIKCMCFDNGGGVIHTNLLFFKRLVDIPQVVCKRVFIDLPTYCIVNIDFFSKGIFHFLNLYKTTN